MTYLVYRDYNAGTHHIGYDYTTIEAKDQFEAVCIADKLWSEESDRLYLMRIMKKAGNVEKMEDGWKKQRFEAVLCKRSNNGWHKNDSKHCESTHTTNRCCKKDIEYFA
jgi:cobalamin-dependent methionine synthase I